LERRSFVQDFFFELMRDSQRVRAVYLSERERWIAGIHIPGREELLFELEMVLRGIDRFFNPRNLFGDAEPPPGRDYLGELKAARDAVHRAIHLARRLIARNQEQALLFRSFLEGSVTDDRARARLATELREQRTPEESLYLLRTGLVAHQGILDHLLRLDHAPQGLYLDVGRALQHELYVSRYFCPPAALEFRGEYDRISSLVLLEALHKLGDEKRRRAYATALLGLFRMLRTLRYVPTPPASQPRRVAVVLALARSEVGALIAYLETDLPRLCATPEGVGNAGAVGRAAAAALRRALDDKPVPWDVARDRERIDATRDGLVWATKAAIAEVAKGIDPALEGPELYEDQKTRLAQSARLRRDLWVFHQLTLLAEKALADAQPAPGALGPLRRFAGEFRDVSYQLLRKSDREAFDRFLELLDAFLARASEGAADAAQKLRDDCRRFAEMLRTALQTVDRRAELNTLPADPADAAAALARHLGSS
jgi:hypothetical protein